ncbi:hypothetical protein CALCODRAFT_504523 [Calocera cornea HHB12733]|uniref:Uncharacterized protein n=1 Tax=Calocera cornea HHB12733 TaxID=1353952 RepID=A0A165CDA5_9BASI|nr:hypothetical protein CALCODRAFT_504523 [Calocera cornea HHB12733]
MAVGYGTWYTMDNNNMISLSIPGLCAPTDRPSWIWLMWPWAIIFQSTVCALLLYKFWESRKTQGGQYSGSLMSCLIRDGVFYNVILLACQTLNLVFYLALPDALFLFAFVPDWAISISLIGRIYLNLRDVANPHEWAQATTLFDNTKQTGRLEPELGGAGRPTRETFEMDSESRE